MGSVLLDWLKGLHYPSSPENAAKVAAALPEARDRMQVIRYGQDHWDASRIEAEINQAAEWARQRGVPLICNEFGVFRDFSDPQDRARGSETCARRWNATTSAGRCGTTPAISAWSLTKDGPATLDETTVRALGLRMPAARGPTKLLGTY